MLALRLGRIPALPPLACTAGWLGPTANQLATAFPQGVLPHAMYNPEQASAVRRWPHAQGSRMGGAQCRSDAPPRRAAPPSRLLASPC